jgi:hypothetical protein
LSSASATYQPIGSYIKLTSTLQSGATFYVSSGTVNGPLYVNNLTDSALTNGQCVQAGANGLLTVTGTSCGSGAGTITSVVAGTDLTGGGNSGSVTLNLSTPSVVLNTETLQSGTSFYVASGTVAGNLTISTINVNNSVELAGSYGLPGQILTSEGSAPPSWQSTIGSGVSFATGTILQTPSAPLGGTWLACDGSAQSTSTYPALYAAIGQTYMNFTSTFPTSTNSVSAASIPIWLGTTTANWLVDSANGTAVWWGSTGTWLTQTSVGSGLSALTANLAVGYALSYTNTTSAALTTSLSNISFAGNTLPTAPGSFQKVIAPGNASTAVFLYCVTGSQTVYTMTKGGTIWASTAGALPKTGTPGAIWWDGTDWNILMTNGVLEQTSLVSGTANWTVAYSSTSILAMYAPIANNQQNAEVGSFDNAPNVVLAPFSAGNSIVSTNSLVTSQQYPQSFVTYQSPTSVFWNGYVYVAIVAFNGSTAVNNVVPQYIESTIYTSKDGKQWINDTTGIFMCPAAQFTGTMTNTLSANTTTGAFLMLGENPGGPSPGGTSLMIVTPTVNPQSQFNLPLKPGYYIRAL